jgi:hypothetical protein
MALFSGYIVLVLTGVFGRVPCSCGGVIGSLGWWEHLVFNVVFLGIGIWGMKLGRMEVGSRKKLRMMNEE